MSTVDEGPGNPVTRTRQRGSLRRLPVVDGPARPVPAPVRHVARDGVPVPEARRLEGAPPAGPPLGVVEVPAEVADAEVAVGVVVPTPRPHALSVVHLVLPGALCVCPPRTGQGAGKRDPNPRGTPLPQTSFLLPSLGRNRTRGIHRLSTSRPSLHSLVSGFLGVPDRKVGFPLGSAGSRRRGRETSLFTQGLGPPRPRGSLCLGRPPRVWTRLTTPLPVGRYLVYLWGRTSFSLSLQDSPDTTHLSPMSLPRAGSRAVTRGLFPQESSPPSVPKKSLHPSIYPVDYCHCRCSGILRV